MDNQLNLGSVYQLDPNNKFHIIAKFVQRSGKVTYFAEGVNIPTNCALFGETWDHKELIQKWKLSHDKDCSALWFKAYKYWGIKILNKLEVSIATVLKQLVEEVFRNCDCQLLGNHVEEPPQTLTIILNHHQELVLKEFKNQHTIVTARAGTGKTTLIMECIKDLLSQSHPHILYCCFNSANAKEASYRLSKIANSQFAFATTIHSIGKELLGNQAILSKPTLKKEGSSRFTQLMSSYPKKWPIAKDLCGNKPYSFIFKLCKLYAAYQLRCLDQDIHDTEAMMSLCNSVVSASLQEEAELLQLLPQMDSACLKSTSIDFDDMLYRPYKLSLEPSSKAFDYIFVDEVQDLNLAQMLLLSKYVQKDHTRVFLVGDPLQSIYEFAGATGLAFETILEKITTRNPGKSKSFNLPETRRCPSSHVELVKEMKLLDDFHAVDVDEDAGVNPLHL